MAEGPSQARAAQQPLTEGEAPSPNPSRADQDQVLALARLALDRGDYGLVVRQLEPLCEQEPSRTRLGGDVRLLLATALLGQGQVEQAGAVCRQLRNCADAELKRQARDMEEVLQAPGLERPREWSVTLPSLGAIETMPGGSKGLASRRRKKPMESPPPPPVGSTRAPLGFAIAVTVLLVLLTTLLGGCIRINTEVAFPAPGRMQISEQFSSRSGLMLPWQRQLEQTLRGLALSTIPATETAASTGTLAMRSGVLPAREAISLLEASLKAASALADLALPAPSIQWHEQNWLVGVHQHLLLDLDLEALQALPGLELNLVLKDTRAQAVRQALPEAIRQEGNRLVWPLRPGEPNRLELRCWRWSRLGLGTVGVALLLPLALLLQRQRWRAGFGWPELPA